MKLFQIIFSLSFITSCISELKNDNTLSICFSKEELLDSTISDNDIITLLRKVI